MNLMHIEDDHDIREIVKMSLEMVGDYSVTQFDCGPAALAAAPEVRPDVILLDVMMPDLTGPETLSKLRAFDHLASVPAIYMTAHARTDEIEDLQQTGAVGVIVKPFDPMTLAQQIADLIEG